MKVVIFAGGYGTRISEESQVRPKPLVEIGGKPILWHIMKIYSSFGYNDFVICAGYKSHMVKEYFNDYMLHSRDVTFHLALGNTEVHANGIEDWRVTVIDTGLETMTGGRLKRVKEHIGNETFFLTYGDGVSTVDIAGELAQHKATGAVVTMTTVQPSGRFGAVNTVSGSTVVDQFKEKPRGDGAWINGGFFVCEPEAIDYVIDDQTVWEQEPLTTLAREGKLHAFKHEGFWQPMDTLRDKVVLEKMWTENNAPWKVW